MAVLITLVAAIVYFRIFFNSSLFLLRHLQTLYLFGNDFRGSPILAEFGQFKNMTHFDLSDSNFSGHVPMEISHLSKLVSLGLGGSSFYGGNKSKIDAATFKALSRNLTRLRDFILTGNIFQLPKLQGLYLFGNEAPNGSFPESNWSSHLEALYLSDNRFSIDLPLLLKNVPRSLTDLSLGDSNLVGSYPALLSNLTQLVYLDLSSNFLSGKIPPSLLNFKRLRSLDLSYNNFLGQLPGNFSSHDSSNHLGSSFLITTLSLSNNRLNGTIPSWIYALPCLEVLELSNNLFTGEIDGGFQSTSLHTLSLGNNMLHGLIPRSVFQSLNLDDLDLSSNNFTGTLELEKLLKSKELSSLDLSNNNLSVSFENSKNHSFPNLQDLGLSSCNVSEFPHFLRSSKWLSSLHLSHNQIQGSVPKWLWEVGKNSLDYLNLSHILLTYIEPLPWNNLGYLDLRSNLFSGPLPIASPILQFLSVSKNQFVGDIPTSICNMSSLWMLDFSHNNLSGIIPQCMGNFSKWLSVLDLHGNKLHGTVRTTFAKGNSLRNLDLNSNHLEGPLPRSLVYCRNLEVLDLGNNLLNDTFPDWLETLPNLRVLVLRSNRFYGSIGNSKTRNPFRGLRIMDLSNNEFSGILPTKYFENFKAMMNAEKTMYTYEVT
ncbi:LRR domain containing protein [Parasponia andersonii]|uniref:non-specific serine/threonine protein kinase n=1 Tax=Parasponia andersonii TaxID=3476 RepID=A0A2P5B3A9_PARAD|nr:LRR domain containing protein [Parasponia andersonii]